MNKDVVVEIDGCKITPEFVELVKTYMLPNANGYSEFKETLFGVQSGIITSIAKSSDSPQPGIESMNCAIINFSSFIDRLVDLRKEGKF